MGRGEGVGVGAGGANWARVAAITISVAGVNTMAEDFDDRGEGTRGKGASLGKA